MPEQIDEKAKKCLDMLAFLKDIRLPYEPMIDNIITYVNHSRRKITDKDLIKGQKTGIEVYDGTALRAKELLVDGTVGYFCPRNDKWFGLAIPAKFNFPRASGMRAWTGKRMDEYPQVKEWLEAKEEVFYSYLQGSNFYDVISEFISDGATPGTAHINIEEEVKTGKVIFTVPHFRECFIAENQYGIVDTNYRVRKYDYRQLVQKFGKDKMESIDLEFKNNLETNPYAELEVLHAVYPRSDFDSGKENGANKPIASLWILIDKKKMIEESGYYWNPNVTWRWRKNSDEWYGRSPSWDAFVEIMLSQQKGRTNIIAGQTMAEGPIVAPSDLRGQINRGPKGTTYVDDMAQMPKPLNTNMQLPYSVEDQQRSDQAIREHFHVDFFLMLYQAMVNKVELTATQVMEMAGEKAAVLGTRMGNLGSEGFNPIIHRVDEIGTRAGRMPLPPQILWDYGFRIEIDYLSSLALAQKRLPRLRSLRGGIQIVGEISNINLESPAVDVINLDETIRETLDATGFPTKCLRPEDQVKAIREQRAKQRQEQQTVENLPKIAKAMQSAGKTMEGGSPLDLMTGGKKAEKPEEKPVG